MIIYDTTPKYRVKEAAELLNLSPHTIRYYDKVHLIPNVHRNNVNVRLFSEQELQYLKIIHCLRASDLPINEVRHFMELLQEGDSTSEDRQQIMLRHEKLLEAKLAQVSEQLNHIRYGLSHHEEIESTYPTR